MVHDVLVPRCSECHCALAEHEHTLCEWCEESAYFEDNHDDDVEMYHYDPLEEF